ncbi:MerR family transcriptional regulator [Amycolatopsis mediterranei S699]|uniref:MerR family transcriptional regulator n=2 Tax=Amycolatopsis mediterranei TaxID=33910 RepID=A0A0H3D5X9_AMYMU|nr:MerR family transcriptional regulator [Amycolatopsis mediterranei]ADJ46031.1 MerR family transcriptional regulator [Amycolatopsis mediterranei U32]AEK42816.1 MerR family transcriptional regulator [Amycolatopsis mediterranei S699]AFO77741.1 MerR family transcriptional regulator [Amycolatopsis mediterranei S699]AGT84869.1 MerR family transcriptional regulator [Amycolatopsis mediterranei RB]KDO05566.1 MerR family transcriptional regulator [Amycolatopsis mediterranei]
MDDENLLTIGALAARTGLSVKTIRFYSDKGIVPATWHNAAGYRLYDAAALARLELVRTLRELDIDLATVRRVLAGETSLAEVAAAHAAALDVQIRALRLRRAVLTAVAKRESTPREMDLMHKLVNLSDAERRRFIHDFVDDTFGGVDANPAMVELLRSTMPELPEDATPEQVEAWMELVELVQDTGFRAAVRRMAEYQAAQRADGDTTGLHHDLTEAVREDVGRALAAGIAPDSEQAGDIVASLTARYAETFGKADDDQLKRWILERLDVADDRRVTRYWQLVAAVNGWPPVPDPGPVFTWFGRAVRARLDSRSRPGQAWPTGSPA